jgi:hypothetical protein
MRAETANVNKATNIAICMVRVRQPPLRVLFNLRCLPLRVKGIPVVRDIFRFALVTLDIRFRGKTPFFGICWPYLGGLQVAHGPKPDLDLA